jgi:four helix bundle protein
MSDDRKKNRKRNLIEQKSFDFALDAIRLYQKMKANREYDIGRQLLRSGTSIGANVSEALAAQSRREFISKMSIASKEARETRFWLELIHESQLLSVDLSVYLKNCEELIKIITSIVKTAQEKDT